MEIAKNEFGNQVIKNDLKPIFINMFKFKIYNYKLVSKTLRNPTEALKTLSEKSRNKLYRLQRLYRNLYNPEFYYLAYNNIYTSQGNMTAGVDGQTKLFRKIAWI